MANIGGTGIFWTVVFAVMVILSLATFIGRIGVIFFPNKLKGLARFYLSPALGLSTLAIIASLLGRYIPLGDSIVIPCLVMLALLGSLAQERNRKQAVSHALIVSGFGMCCGLSVLAPLYVYGAFNAHNDAFTYLVHSNWLQAHAFNDAISKDGVTPFSTQISLYQHAGFRMGASFLLAFFQAILNLSWSYEVYPALVISAITVCCFSFGFPLARLLRPMSRIIRLSILILPAFSLGGLIFGANLGFLPQTLGLSLGASLLFMSGYLFKWVATSNIARLDICKSTIPSVILFTGAIFAYSEIAPFLLIAILSTGCVLVFRLRFWRNLLEYGVLALVFSTLILNTELVRAYSALKSQSNAVVGSPVEWNLLGFIAHAMGVHGGAWDVYQWTNPVGVGVLSFGLGLLLLGATTGLLAVNWRLLLQATLSGILMPSVIILATFVAGILYFRYFVISPFPKGMGQSWSQFKLADWAHPFMALLVLFSISALRSQLGKFFDRTIVALFVIGMVSTLFIGVARIKPVMNYYHEINDLNQFYLNFRKTVLATCPLSTPVYLALGGQNHKFRQIAVLYLYDRVVTSDWTDDGYIYARLPIERQTQSLNAGNCIVEPTGMDGWLSKGSTVGPFRIGIFDGRGQIKIASVTGAFDRENDGKNWWHWVSRKVTFKVQPQFLTKENVQTKLQFEYGTRGQQTLTLRVVNRNGAIREFQLPSKGDAPAMFDKLIDLPPSELTEFNIETNGKATPLGEHDARMASWIIRNVKFEIITPK